MPAKYVAVGTWNLHYLHTGPTTLPDVPPALDEGELFLCVPGAGRNAGDFRRTLAGLAGAHTAVALDLPGHGRSTGLEGCESIEAYADLVAEFAAALRLRRLVLVGWSMGASIGIAFAARHAERLAGLVLIAGSARWTLDAAALARVRDVVRGRLPQQFDTAMFSPATPMAVMREAWTEQVKTDPRVLHDDLLAGAAFDARPLLAQVRMPTLVVHGADDRVTSVERGRELAAGIPGARLEIVEQAGHIVQLEQPARVRALLAGFAEGLA